MDPTLMAKGKVVTGSSTSKSKSSRKKGKRGQTPGQSSGRPQLGTYSGEPTSERLGRNSKRKDVSSTSYNSNNPADGKAASITMNTLHIIDIAIGTAYIVIGALEQSTQAKIVGISLGSLLLLGSMCGIFGYYSCHRNGLIVGMVIGSIACCVYIAGFIWGLVSWDTLVDFITGGGDNKEEESFLEDKKMDVIVIMAVLAIVEVIRIITTGFTRNQLLKQDAQSKSGSYRSTSTSSSSISSWNFLSWCGLTKKKRSDDFVMFDDNASMESALLWSKDGGQPSSDDYLEFVPEHERGLANYASNAVMPLPPEDKTDY